MLVTAQRVFNQYKFAYENLWYMIIIVRFAYLGVSCRTFGATIPTARELVDWAQERLKDRDPERC